MDIKTAIAKMEGLRNFYRSVEHIEEVLEVAQGAEQFVAERKAEAEKLASIIAERKAELADVELATADARKAQNKERQEHEAAIVAAEEIASKARATRMTEFEKNFTMAMELASKQREALDASVRRLANIKAGLEAEVATLTHELSKLKSRISGV